LDKPLIMEMKFLFPRKYRLIGWILVVPCAVIMVMTLYFDFSLPFLNYVSKSTHISLDPTFIWTVQSHNFTGDIAGVLLLTGLLMVAFSKEKIEDERTQRLRLESLLWAVYLNSVLIILAIILIYGNLFFSVMVYNICSTLVFFIARFRWVMDKEALS
jgi:hypothetical protein